MHVKITSVNNYDHPVIHSNYFQCHPNNSSIFKIYLPIMLCKDQTMTEDSNASQAFDDFISNTTCHGISRVFHPIGSQRFSTCFRWIWMAVWLVAALTVIYWCCLIFKDYHEYDTVSKVEIIQENMVQFPTVTFCKGHKQLSKRRVVQWLQTCKNDTIIDSQEFSSFCQEWSKKWIDISNDTKRQRKYESDLKEVLNVKYPELLKNFTMAFSDFILKASISFNYQKDPMSFWNFSFVKYNCHSFNSDGKHSQNQPGFYGGQGKHET